MQYDSILTLKSVALVVFITYSRLTVIAVDPSPEEKITRNVIDFIEALGMESYNQHDDSDSIVGAVHKKYTRQNTIVPTDATVDNVCKAIKTNKLVCHPFVKLIHTKKDFFKWWLEGCGIHQISTGKPSKDPAYSMFGEKVQESHLQQAILYLEACQRHSHAVFNRVNVSKPTEPNKEMMKDVCKEVKKHEKNCKLYVDTAEEKRSGGNKGQRYEDWMEGCSLYLEESTSHSHKGKHQPSQ